MYVVIITSGVTHVQDGHDLGWRQVECLGSALWAVDTVDCLMVRNNVTPDNIEGRKLHDHDDCVIFFFP